MSKQDLSKLMKSNNPVNQKREVITPANLYDNASIPASQHTGTPANPQASKPVKQQAGKPASQPTVKPASLTPVSQHTSKQATTKYTTYLTTDTVKRLKRYAFDNDIKATQVLQEATDKYLKSKGA
jgi:hypothetical protein